MPSGALRDLTPPNLYLPSRALRGMRLRRSLTLLALTALLASTVLAGCITGDDVGSSSTNVDDVTSAASYVTDGPYSFTLEEGTHDILPVVSEFIEVEIPVTEGGAGAAGTAEVHMGIWLPDVPEGTTVPVVADVGPYYGDGDVPATEPAERLGGFLIENLVPHGFAVAQVSVFGTGQSSHCMDLMGESEQLGIDAAVTALGEAEWSNGNVGLIGRSYDGSTPWEAATFGNPHLKTIAPISGLTGMHELMWRNGSAEFRAPIMHNVVYGPFGYDGDEGDVQNALCKDHQASTVQGLGAYLTGDHFAPEVNDYWAERYFLDRALENYEGSVLLIHGLQDWNVDPHMAFPTHHKLEDAGLDVRGLYGQWAHDYPDRLEEHEDCDGLEERCHAPESVRLDWAQDLLEWFTFYLKEEGPQPALIAEVQDDQGRWRVEDTYPPRDAARVPLTLDQATRLHEGPDVVAGAEFFGLGAANELTFRFDALSSTEDTHVAGNARFHVTVTPSGPGGQLFAELRDAETDDRLGHAIMDLRFHDGGREMGTVTPGQPIVAKMEFQVMDVVLPAGHALELVVSHTGEDYLPSAVTDPVRVHVTEESVLTLPTVDPAEDTFFDPPRPAGT